MTKRAGGDLGGWILAIVVVALPVLGAGILGDPINDWIPVYVAGGFGGMVLESLLGRWQLELPTVSERLRSSPAEPPADEAEEAPEEESDVAFGSPMGPRVDLGFLGRFFTAGLAAFVLLILGALALADQTPAELTEGGSNLSIAWGLAIGASSPAVWRGIRKIVDARTAAVRRYYVKQLSATEEKIKTVKAGHKAVLDHTKQAKRKVEEKRRRRKGGVGQVIVPKEELGQELILALRADPNEPEIEERAQGHVDKLVRRAEQPFAQVDEEAVGEDEELASLDRAIGALEILQRQLDT